MRRVTKRTAWRGVGLSLVLAAALYFPTAPGPPSASAVYNGEPISAPSWIAQIWVATKKKAVEFNCGGELIRPNWVLTAAHCVTSKGLKLSDVRLGRQRLTSGGGEVHRVDQILVAPHHHVQSGPRGDTQMNDVALLRLSKGSSLEPIRLAASSESALSASGRAATLLGWGHQSSSDDVSDVLRWASVTLAKPSMCEDRFKDPGDHKYNPSVTLCGIQAIGGGDGMQCPGDSGGPLAHASSGTSVLLGVASFGSRPCDTPAAEGVWARVSGGALRSWILDTAGCAAGGPEACPVVLGRKHWLPNGQGWGAVKPKTVFNGGDPSGLVDHIHWKSWGGSEAVGRGKTAIYKPSGGYYSKHVPADLRATNVGICAGRRAYRHLEIRVPSKPGGPMGQWQAWSNQQNLCKPYGEGY
jgi:trypsin